MSTLYDVLEVRTDASQEDIRAAYRQLAKERHPDVGGTVEAMQELTAAYAVLRDPDARATYDRELAQRRRRPRSRNVPAAEPPPDVLAPRRRSNPWDEILERLAGAVLREADTIHAERFGHIPRERRPPSLSEILAATADPAPPKPRRQGSEPRKQR